MFKNYLSMSIAMDWYGDRMNSNAMFVTVS